MTKKRTPIYRSENFPFFHQNINIANKQFRRNQSHYTEDEDFFNQNQQRYNSNQRNNNWNND